MKLLNFWTLFSGIILMLWIALEWWIFGFNWLSNVYFIFGILEAFTAGYGFAYNFIVHIR